MRIGILNTDTIKIEFATKYGQYPAMFSKALLGADPDLQLNSYEVQAGEFPADIDECDAYLITRSKVSAYDDLPWLNELKIFIQSLHRHKKKINWYLFWPSTHCTNAGRLSGAITIRMARRDPSS